MQDNTHGMVVVCHQNGSDPFRSFSSDLEAREVLDNDMRGQVLDEYMRNLSWLSGEWLVWLSGEKMVMPHRDVDGGQDADAQHMSPASSECLASNMMYEKKSYTNWKTNGLATELAVDFKHRYNVFMCMHTHLYVFSKLYLQTVCPTCFLLPSLLFISQD